MSARHLNSLIPKVSIVIPVYNALEYLPYAIASVEAQSFQDFEVLIVDDGSTDNIEEWFLENIFDCRYRLISQENQGISGARNRGVKEAVGEYVAFLDADDFWAPEKLEQQTNCLDHEPGVALVHTWLSMVDVSGQPTGRVLESYAEGDAYKSLLVKNSVACASVMLRRQCFEKVGYFDLDLLSMEDWDMWIRMARHYRFAVIPDALTFYRQVPTSLTKDCLQMERAFDMAIEKIFKTAPDECASLKQLSQAHANFCLAWKALQTLAQDSRLASRYYLKSFRYAPFIFLSKESARLFLAIMIASTLGHEGYSTILGFFNSLRRSASQTKSQ